MGEPRRGFSGRRHVTTVSAGISILALALFAYSLWNAGPGRILDGVLGIGPGGFALILLLSGIRLALRTVAWTLCVDPPIRLRFRDAFPAMLIGEALGNLTPLANVLAEPAKCALVRKKVPLVASFSALVVENIIYTVTVAFIIIVGALAFLGQFRVGKVLLVVTIGSIAGVGLVVLLAWAMLRANAKPITRGLEWLHRRNFGRLAIEPQIERVRDFEARINGFTTRNRHLLLPLVGLDMLFQVAGISEMYVTLALIGGASRVTVLSALILESTGRVINMLFRFVPMRLGVDEAGSGLVTSALHLGTAAGVTVGLVRKARLMVWTAVGVLLLLHRGLTVKRALDEAQAVAAERA
jgi:hypothetical protein